MRPALTPSQTVGPFFALGLTPQAGGYALRDLAGPETCGPEAPGQRIRVVGEVLDGDGLAIPDALVEIWQADADGKFPGAGAHPRFQGFARSATTGEGFAFTTVRPGSVGAGHAPHIALIVFMRGLLAHVCTRLYFADDAQANAVDPVFAAVPRERRETLLARLVASDEPPTWRFDIRMQGPGETVFFDI